jgi:hypothetical protein
MGKRPLAILVLASAIILALLASGCLVTSGPYGLFSMYQYNLQIQSDTALHNVTFIIPLPVKNGMPVVGNDTLTADDFQQPGISAYLTQSPPEIHLSDAVSLPAGYQPWFVVIKADNLTPANESGELYTLNMHSSYDYTRLKDFRVVPNPVGYEALIVPKFNFTWKEPKVAVAKEEVIQYQSYLVPQDTLMSADYQTIPSANVTVAFSYSVGNHWTQWYDESWENFYQESFTTHFKGEPQGWHRISGSIEPVPDYDNIVWYPNLTCPYWQQILNQTPPYSPPY